MSRFAKQTNFCYWFVCECMGERKREEERERERETYARVTVSSYGNRSTQNSFPITPYRQYAAYRNFFLLPCGGKRRIQLSQLKFRQRAQLSRAEKCFRHFCHLDIYIAMQQNSLSLFILFSRVRRKIVQTIGNRTFSLKHDKLQV